MKNDAVVKMTPEDKLRMETIRMDNDTQDALAFVKILLERIEAGIRKNMKSHLDT